MTKNIGELLVTPPGRDGQRERNTDEEKKAIKQGHIPNGWKDKPAKLRQKDRAPLICRVRKPGTQPVEALNVVHGKGARAAPLHHAGFHNIACFTKALGTFTKRSAGFA